MDGTAPSAVFARGYYTRSVVVAYDWDGEAIRERWTADSGHVPMDNPFDAAPHGGQGSDPDLGALSGQGFHSLSVADVDDDGRQEIVYGSATLDDDGSLLYSSHAEGPLTNNGTKGNPGLVADVFGDWREELILRTEDSEALRVHTSTEVTDRKLHTLMHDPQYRVGVAWQQTTYNQPTYPSFYFGSDIDWSRVDVPEIVHPGE